MDWGNLRTGKVSLSGTDYLPDIPVEHKLDKTLIEIDYTSYDDLMKAMFYMDKQQPFWDGNKRTVYLYLMFMYDRNTTKFFSFDQIKFSENLHEYYNGRIDLDDLKTIKFGRDY